MKQETGHLDRRDFLKFAAVASTAAVAMAEQPAVAAAMPALPPRVFLHPHRVRYDRHCLIVEDKPFFLYSGCFHYYRCAKPLWRARFAKIKEAGFNTVQTYTPWNMHEMRKPADIADYSQVNLRDLDEWLTMATEEFGLYVTIRPGPYICAEWDTGGFPQWLIALKPKGYQGEWLRSDDPLFMAWSRHWYNAVCPVIAKHQITRKPPGKPGVLIFQVENEYDFPSFPLHVKRTYVESLVEGARHNGIDVPLFINWGSCVLGSKNPLLRQVFDTMDFYPGSNIGSVLGSIEGMRYNQPDAPLMTAELQGGWFTGVGSAPALRVHEDYYAPGLSPAQINNLTLFCIQNGVTMVNYYMLFGGTNFGGRPAAGIATSYDYSAPIRENGGVGAKYLRVKALAAMLRQHGAQLAESTHLPITGHTGFADVSLAARKSPNGGIYLFIRTSQNKRPRAGRAKVKMGSMMPIHFDYALEALGSKVLYFPPGAKSESAAHFLPEVQKPLTRPTHLPTEVKIAAIRAKADPLPTAWRPIRTGASLAELGFYESGFNYYRARLMVKPRAKHDGKLLLAAEIGNGDTATALVDGKLIYRSNSSGQSAEFQPAKPLDRGMHHAVMVYENRGHPNGGMGMEALYGIFDVGVKSTEILGQAVDSWRMKIISAPHSPEDVPLVGKSVSTIGWRKVACTDAASANQLSPSTWAVFRSTLRVAADAFHQQKTTLHFSRIDDAGWIFINGKLLGKTNDWSRSWNFDARKYLTVGENNIAVLVHNKGGGGGLGGVSRISSKKPASLARMIGPMEIAAAPSGLSHGWHTTDFDDSDWSQHSLPLARKDIGGAHLLTWYRMEFTLPAVASDIWVPWCLKIQAQGTGFIYINGHEYGRFWEYGGQREYYMPDCWLRRHDQGKNVVAVCLRAADKPAAVLSASIEPYNIFAEFHPSQTGV